MFNKLNRLWMRSLAKTGKSRIRAVSTLLKAVQTAPRRARSTAKPKTPSVANMPTAPRRLREPQGGSWHSAIFAGAKLPVRHMRYRLFLPDTGSAGLVVMLHGCQQNADDFAAGTGMHRLAAAKGYAVLYPEQSARSHPHRCWKWYDAATQRGGGDAETIAAMIEMIVARYAIDGSRVYVCGISAGAAMAHILALTHPHLMAAVGLHSGPVFGSARTAVGAYGVMQHGSATPLAPMRALLARQPGLPPVPAIIVGGGDDEVVRPVNQLQLVRQCSELYRPGSLVAAPVQAKPFGRVSKAWPRKRAMRISDYTAGSAVMIRSVQIEGLGHAWSGGDEAFSFNARGPDAGKLMLEFFARHRRKI
ncbi:alpha/beta hydrolase family esterase [Herbaspirillum sp. alder98]|uniref:extracellular catalytic domain type 1 short-chain-length polyhydroxyalkanoate depolymerase n=1 Tax=Herbaspirillum sp. alder98 TaxID=2913096 RepID=UPI001CD91701|nr:PHB depolymerase family esterase [Herbaspirillum sp. alder98]